MFMQTYESLPANLDEEFARPVESIMRCEDFKSNFARRLSNRYTTRTPLTSPKQDTGLKLCPQDVKSSISDNVPERIERPQLSKNIIMEQNGESVKPPDKSFNMKSDIRCTEVTALNMEVETLRWQLAQTEANRQMHIALLKQIVTFLNKVKDHIEYQKNESADKEPPKPFPRAYKHHDLPRSKSVLHVNKNVELPPTKKISPKKISKSISNVNGFKDFNGSWNQLKSSPHPDTEASKKISEEMSRLITLANTVLSTKLPDLACTYNDIPTEMNGLSSLNQIEKVASRKTSTASLNTLEQSTTNAFILNTMCDTDDPYNDITNKFAKAKDDTLTNFIGSPSPLTCGLENDFAAIQVNDKEHTNSLSAKNRMNINVKASKITADRKNDYNHMSNFIEDESGFSSMSSFQEIGIPIISIIPPSPCKEVGYLEEVPDIMGDHEKWKTDTIELDKQSVKVFWV
ncbi:uncharacterized protein LOC113518656 [Galleria mellonella]|uniref:Uncharacterized protein LOC113518656 n=1 Tax=Galleria mellonella TaxID=7137 RepID=A0ABM3MML3_GALME|nr:uncharacterized protein LOC113518656 [Galleria mellonella]